MTTPNTMTVNSTSALHVPSVAARHVARDAALVLSGLVWVSLMVYMLLVVAGSWTVAAPAAGPGVSPAPAPIVHVAPVDHPISVPARPQPGFGPR
jgi:hypothetical protein